MFNGPMRINIGRAELIAVLKQAREHIPQFFTETKETVDDYLNRVESKSGPLVLRGYRETDKETKTVEAVYEFSHLVLQEYFAALAVTHGYYPGAKRDDKTIDLLSDRLDEYDYREIILLSAL
jgi:predicted NACHT family NTPase